MAQFSLAHKNMLKYYKTEFSSTLAYFYCTTLNAGWSSREKGVRLSVKCMNWDKTEEKWNLFSD